MSIGSWKLVGETSCGLRVLLGGVGCPGGTVFKIEQGKGGEAVTVFFDCAPELVALLERKPGRKERVGLEAPGLIRRYREARKQTQAQLAGIVGVTTNTVARWERGERRPRGEPRARLLRWAREKGKVDEQS